MRLACRSGWRGMASTTGAARRLSTRGRLIDRVMHPAVPRGPITRGFRVSVVDHPAPLKAEVGIDLTAFGPVVVVPEFVRRRRTRRKARSELGSERLPVPPGEDFQAGTTSWRDPGILENEASEALRDAAGLPRCPASGPSWQLMSFPQAPGGKIPYGWAGKNFGQANPPLPPGSSWK